MEQQSSQSSAVNAPSVSGINNTSDVQPPENRVRQLHNGRHSRNVQRESPTERSPRDVSLDVDAYELMKGAYETLNADDVQRRNDDGDKSQYNSLQL